MSDVACYACGVRGRLRKTGDTQLSAATNKPEPFVRCGACRSVYSTDCLDRAPTAPKEPQRCQRCGGRGTVPDMSTASIRTDTLPPTIDCPDCTAESGAAPREETRDE